MYLKTLAIIPFGYFSDMETESVSVTSYHDACGKGKMERNKNVNSRNLTQIDTISVDVSNNNETKERIKAEENETKLKSVGKLIGFSFATIAVSAFSVVPFVMIPRTNSIIHQSAWMELLLPNISFCMIVVGNDLLNLAVWSTERSLLSFKIYLKMLFVDVILSTFFFVLSYIIWSVILGYNHPLPYLVMTQHPVWIIYVLGFWYVLPSQLIAKEGFRRKLRMYLTIALWATILTLLIDLLDYLFNELPVSYQFFVAFMVAACRELDKRVMSKLVNKMTEKQDENAEALVTIIISAYYSFFVAVRLTEATALTIFCFLFIDSALHTILTHQYIKEYKKVNGNNSEMTCRKKGPEANKLVTVELVEGLSPIIYSLCITMAYYGPNAELFANIGSSFWGKPIDDITYLLIIMYLLFSIDSVCAIINSVWIWKATNINMIQQFAKVIRKYWHFMAMKLSYMMFSHFVVNDVNLGVDTSAKFEWITPEGRLNLLYNSSELSYDEKSMILSPEI